MVCPNSVILSDLIKVVEKWNIWHEVRDNAAKVPDLDNRLKKIESLLNGRAPGDTCPKCGQRTLRVTRTWRMENNQTGRFESLRQYKCESEGCKFSEQRMVP